MVRCGVSGVNTSTCFVAALDCLLEERSIPIEVYCAFNNLCVDNCLLGYDKDASDKMFKLVITHAFGQFDPKKIKSVICRVKTDAIDILNKARIDNKFVIIQTGENHDVGLKPSRNNTWKVVGNGASKYKNIATEDVFRHLFQPNKIHLQGEYNILLLG